jgi:hypothetical protein
VNPSAAQEAPTVNLPAKRVAAVAVRQQVGWRPVELEEAKVFAQIDGGGCRCFRSTTYQGEYPR